MNFALLLAFAAATDHSAWTRLLERFVGADARVDYRGWKASGTAELDQYVAGLSEPWPAATTAAERKAASINAYNALVVQWILLNYPVESIWKTDNPFRKARHRIDGKEVSLDGIENGLRELGDPRVHATLVCAALSCPPLRREAYTAERLDEQMDDNARAWLADSRWNEFDPAQRRAEVSAIFQWFKKDFERDGGTVEKFLARYAPETAQPMLEAGSVTLRHRTYRWGLNDRAGVGEGFGGVSLWWNVLRNRF
ncbi:MAG: DUF547 domain-containing protein [Bryobacteraceae bacterium]